MQKACLPERAHDALVVRLVATAEFDDIDVLPVVGLVEVVLRLKTLGHPDATRLALAHVLVEKLGGLQG